MTVGSASYKNYSGQQQLHHWLLPLLEGCHVKQSIAAWQTGCVFGGVEGGGGGIPLSAGRVSAHTMTWASLFLQISAGSMSMCTTRALQAKVSSLPVTRSSKRTPKASSRSASSTAKLAKTVPCIPSICSKSAVTTSSCKCCNSRDRYSGSP